MKICWENLENVKFTEGGKFRKGSNTYIEVDKCFNCGESYLAFIGYDSGFCSISCANSNEFNPNYGKPRDEHTKKLISESNKKTPRNWKNNPPFFGRKHSLKSKINISNSLKGKLVGPKNPAWKGGISCEPYYFEWSSDLREFIKERDGHKCLNPCCSSSKPGDLTIHHIDYVKKHCRPNNLITICRSCNSRANKDRKWHKAWYQAIINKRYGGL